MKRTWMAALLAGGAVGAAGASVTVIDVSGMSSWGVLGDPANSVLLYQDDPQFFPLILEIDYLLNVQTFGNSSLADVGLLVSNSDQSFLFQEFFPGDGMNVPGSAIFSGTILTEIHLNPDAIIRIEMFERVDSVFGPDATLLAGSALTMRYFIPGPGVLGVVGMSGLVLARRRR